MNIALASLLAAILAFGTGVIVGGEMIASDTTKSCRVMGAFRWSDTVYDCRTRANTQTEQERP